MKFSKIQEKRVEISISEFSKNSKSEYHLMFKPKGNSTFTNQLEDINNYLDTFLKNNKLDKNNVILKRYFLSDITNQNDLYKEDEHDCAISIVQQPMLNNAKIGAWVYIIKDNDNKLIKSFKNNELTLKTDNYEHIWTTQLIGDTDSLCPYKQTEDIFNNFNNNLTNRGLGFKLNCLRTWLFVRDVDVNYKGLVEARNKFFDSVNMTKDTHFTASTGIEGRSANIRKNVLMDAYSIGGIQRDQIKFLTALKNLNHTHEYGVSFERGTSIDYGDRRHILISGTASIDNKGDVVFVNDIEGQIERTIENIKALLNEDKANFEDIGQLIVYLRDIADYEIVENYFSKNKIEIPYIIVNAPVCRPGWLIEMECIAIKDINSKFENF